MSKVYFLKTNLKEFSNNPYILVKFLEKIGFFSLFEGKSLVGIKMHFGERKNLGYIKPQLIKPVIKQIKQRGVNPFLFDTTTLYRGRRMNAVDYFNLAFFEHNFKLLNIPVIIGDGLKGNDSVEVEIGGKHFKRVKIASLLRDIDFLLVISHLTGHILTGFGASLKNLGMGCSSRAGKMEQHCEVAPSVNHQLCIRCARCIEVCPSGAISWKEKKIYIDNDLCEGCAQCISVCIPRALTIVWSENYTLLQEKMMEYVQGVLKISPQKFFLNFCMFITKECDCISKEEKGVCLDAGILASEDPLSIDLASIETVNQINREDVFKRLYPQIDYRHQFKYARKIGLGEDKYELIFLNPE